MGVFVEDSESGAPWFAVGACVFGIAHVNDEGVGVGVGVGIIVFILFGVRFGFLVARRRDLRREIAGFGGGALLGA